MNCVCKTSTKAYHPPLMLTLNGRESNAIRSVAELKAKSVSKGKLLRHKSPPTASRLRHFLVPIATCQQISNYPDPTVSSPPISQASLGHKCVTS